MAALCAAFLITHHIPLITPQALHGLGFLSHL